jgi:hypothetical protein
MKMKTVLISLFIFLITTTIVSSQIITEEMKIIQSLIQSEKFLKMDPEADDMNLSFEEIVTKKG